MIKWFSFERFLFIIHLFCEAEIKSDGFWKQLHHPLQSFTGFVVAASVSAFQAAIRRFFILGLLKYFAHKIGFISKETFDFYPRLQQKTCALCNWWVLIQYFLFIIVLLVASAHAFFCPEHCPGNHFTRCTILFLSSWHCTVYFILFTLFYFYHVGLCSYCCCCTAICCCCELMHRLLSFPSAGK